MMLPLLKLSGNVSNSPSDPSPNLNPSPSSILPSTLIRVVVSDSTQQNLDREKCFYMRGNPNSDENTTAVSKSTLCTVMVKNLPRDSKRISLQILANQYILHGKNIKSHTARKALQIVSDIINYRSRVVVVVGVGRWNETRIKVDLIRKRSNVPTDIPEITMTIHSGETRDY
nr:hypothetical protein [Tanacetum cinerariifolium]